MLNVDISRVKIEGEVQGQQVARQYLTTKDLKDAGLFGKTIKRNTVVSALTEIERTFWSMVAVFGGCVPYRS